MIPFQAIKVDVDMDGNSFITLGKDLGCIPSFACSVHKYIEKVDRYQTRVSVFISSSPCLKLATSYCLR